jgi:hypothetical protein
VLAGCDAAAAPVWPKGVIAKLVLPNRGAAAPLVAGIVDAPNMEGVVVVPKAGVAVVPNMPPVEAPKAGVGVVVDVAPNPPNSGADVAGVEAAPNAGALLCPKENPPDAPPKLNAMV